MSKNNRMNSPLIILVAIFVVLTGLGFLFKNEVVKNGADLNMLFMGNTILFVLAFFTLRRSLNAINDPNPHVFVRSFYAGFLIRMAVVAVAAFFYIYWQKGNVSKASLFLFMGIYAIYSIVEVSALRKVLKEKKNA